MASVFVVRLRVEGVTPVDEEGGVIVGSAGGRATEICLKASEVRMASKSNGTLRPSRTCRRR